MTTQPKVTHASNAQRDTESMEGTDAGRRRRTIWPLVCGILFGVPVAVIGLMWLTYMSFASAQVNETSRLTPPVQRTSNPPMTDLRMRPEIEVQYREETYQVQVPKVDITGKSHMVTETRTRRVPVMSQRWAGTSKSLVHQPKVIVLANELRSNESDATDEVREKKMVELRELLDQEFREMHQRQASEIQATQERLSSLRKLHEKRGENAAEIVQRRIDQLIGASNPLDWSAEVPSTDVPLQSPASAGELPPASDNSRSELGREDFFKGRTTAEDEYANPFQKLSRTEARDSTRRQQAAQDDKNLAENKLSDIFDLVAKASEANSAFREAELRLILHTQLHKTGRLPEMEFQKSQLTHEAAQRSVKIYAMQLAALKSSLQRDIEFAKDSLTRIHYELQEVTSEGGNASQKRALHTAIQRAEHALQRDFNSLQQFEQAVKLIPPSTPSPDDRGDNTKALNDELQANLEAAPVTEIEREEQTEPRSSAPDTNQGVEGELKNFDDES